LKRPLHCLPPARTVWVSNIEGKGPFTKWCRGKMRLSSKGAGLSIVWNRPAKTGGGKELCKKKLDGVTMRELTDQGGVV